jgi:hypothetical protein
LALLSPRVGVPNSLPTVNVTNKLVSIQFNNGVTFVKDYRALCSSGIGVETFSSSQNGVTVEYVNVNCVTFKRISTPPFYKIEKRLIETVRDR